MASLRHPPLRIACHQFSQAEVEALRSLLGLLATYLRHPWEVGVDATAAAIVLVNLDHPEPTPVLAPGRLVGCAVKPRLKPAGCIHRPLRAAEILALLSEPVAASAPRGTAESEPVHAARRYRLSAWPLDFTSWSRDAWRVLGAMTREHLGLDEITARTGVDAAEVRRTLDALCALGLVDTVVERHAVRRPHGPLRAGWRSLASRVGQLFGVAR